jgi:hypothetical protein
MLHPGTQALLDQFASLVRDAYSEMGVDLTDPAQLQAIRTTWWLVASAEERLPFVLAAISETM